jgi:hypothetical protein
MIWSDSEKIQPIIDWRDRGLSNNLPKCYLIDIKALKTHQAVVSLGVNACHIGALWSSFLLPREQLSSGI